MTFESLGSLLSPAAALDVRRFLVGGEFSSGVTLCPLPIPCACSTAAEIQYAPLSSIKSQDTLRIPAHTYVGSMRCKAQQTV